ncbi:helix-turn-helix domain-containing protein [Paeniglutamicibacter sulfureus]|uniref:helix-turn-helix domain-containing protein n=1 Tax=Paeniglutamicibacter sulfureus TaxID=43666 RepID=UPI00345DD806
MFRLRELREASDLTQVQLAGRLQITQSRLSRIEHGDIERAQVDTLRKGYQVPSSAYASGFRRAAVRKTGRVPASCTTSGN